jgi:hypothetical protein
VVDKIFDITYYGGECSERITLEIFVPMDRIYPSEGVRIALFRRADRFFSGGWCIDLGAVGASDFTGMKLDAGGFFRIVVILGL